MAYIIYNVRERDIKMLARKRLLLYGLSFLTLFLTIGSVITSKKGISIALGYTNHDADTYYNSITASEGKELLTQLQTLQSQKLKSRVGYNSMPAKFAQTDAGGSGKVTAFYNGKSYSYSGNMNREHVWPASKTVGGRDNDPLEDDIHMTRPTLKDDNEGRGNNFYTYKVKTEGLPDKLDTSGWDVAEVKDGDVTYRGDAARIIMYCVVADSRLSLVDKEYDSSSNHTMGKLSRLLEWNLFYPVTERERTRNEAAEALQGNRNPFIDHPEYACKIWGKYNAATQEICNSTKRITTMYFSNTAYTKEVGAMFRPTLFTDPVDYVGTINWSSSDTSIASIGADGLVTSYKEGEVIITATYAMDTSIFAKCTLTLIPRSNPTPTPSGGCGGSIASTSVILSTISLLGISLILFRKNMVKKDETN